MKKILYIIGIRAFIVVGIASALSLSGSHEASAQTITLCESGAELSFDQATDGIAWGLIIIDRVADLSANTVTVTVTNNTPCNLPASLSDHRMYTDYSLATLSQQEFFSGTPTRTVAPSTTEVFTTPIADCLSQYDLWYGDYLVVIPDFLTWGKLLSGDQVRLGQYCVPVVVPPVAPIVASLDADTVCAVPGTPILFTASASGDGILSKTLEKDTNSDSSYGEVVSWGGGPGINSFSGYEGSDYSGIYSIKFMVNGIEMARKDVVVGESCAPPPPIVVPPPVVPPPVILVAPLVVPPVVVPVVIPPVVVVEVVIPPVVPVVVVTTVVPPVVETTIAPPIETPAPSSRSGGGSRNRQSVVIEPVLTISPIVAFVPGLPDTGFGPGEKSLLLNLASLFGLMLLPLFLRSNRKTA